MMFTDAEIDRINYAKRHFVDRFYNSISGLIAPSPFEKGTFAGIRKEDLFISGGSIASLLQGEEPKDYDIYSKVSLKDYFKGKLLEHFYDFIADCSDTYSTFHGPSGKVVTTSAITMKNGTQYILLHSGSPSSIKATFDFLHCTAHFSFADNKLYISRAQYDACVNKKLIVNNQSAVTRKRIKKFAARGYDIKSVQIDYVAIK